MATSGGPIEVLAEIPESYYGGDLAIDASGVYWFVDETDLARVPPKPWKGSIWHVSKTGGDAKVLAEVPFPPAALALDATTIYVVGGDFFYDATGLHGAGGVTAVDKVTGKARVIVRDMGANSVALDGGWIYWGSCEPSSGMLVSGNLRRMSMATGALSTVPLEMGGAIQVPRDISVHAGRIYLVHGAEMSSNSALCSAAKSGGAVDCSLPQHTGGIVDHRFHGDELWIATYPDRTGIHSAFEKHVRPALRGISLAKGEVLGALDVDDVGGVDFDEAEVYWSSGHEILARPKSTFESTTPEDESPW